MGKTIIQTIGPLYGEVVNGTVFGRPNGSVFVPPNNTIAIVTQGDYVGAVAGNPPSVLTAQGLRRQTKVYAESQDISSYMQLQLSESADFETYSVVNAVAGNFNWSPFTIAPNTVTIEGGATYYLRAQLISSTGVPVATSETKTLTGKVVE